MAETASGARNGKSAPGTYGELRRQLQQSGNAWTVDPTVGDDELLPGYPLVGATAAEQMQHWRRQPCATWQLQAAFGAGVPSGPALIEGTYGEGDDSGVGNFDLCVTVGDRVQHWWRHNKSLGPWVLGAEFGEGIRRVVGLLQSTFATNLEIIVQRTDGRHQHHWRDGAGWHAGVIVT